MLAYTAGDSAAFDALYGRHEGGLYRFVRRVLGQPLAAQADEVFQDCWLRIVTARESYSASRGLWKTWAYTIAHNLAMDRLRTSGREVSTDGDALANAEVDDELTAGTRLEWLQTKLDMTHASAEDLSHWRAAGRQLLHCLDALPAVQRAAFLLHHEDGLSIEDVAKALETGFETIKSRMRYALHKLRGCMHAYLVWEGAA